MLVARLDTVGHTELRKVEVELSYKNGAKRITTRLPVIEVILVADDMFLQDVSVEILLEAQDSKGNVVGSALNQSLCNGVNVSTSQLPTITYATLQTNVTESCPDGVTGKRSVPTYVYFYDNSVYQGGYTSTGSSSIGNIESGLNGQLWVWNRLTSQWSTSSLTVNAPTTTRDVNFPNLQCVTGSVTSAQ